MTPPTWTPEKAEALKRLYEASMRWTLADCRDALAEIDRLTAQVREAEARGWQSIETAPRDTDAHFWIVPKSPEETYSDTSGRPITAAFEPHLHFGRYGAWSSLAKAIYWYPAPPPPAREGSAP